MVDNFKGRILVEGESLEKFIEKFNIKDKIPNETKSLVIYTSSIEDGSLNASFVNDKDIIISDGSLTKLNSSIFMWFYNEVSCKIINDNVFNEHDEPCFKNKVVNFDIGPVKIIEGEIY